MKKIFITILLLIISLNITNLSFADINPVSIDDVKDHEKIVRKLNRIIEKLNQDRKDDREDAKDLRKYLKYQLTVDDKIVKKMIQKNWVSTHAEVEVN